MLISGKGILLEGPNLNHLMAGLYCRKPDQDGNQSNANLLKPIYVFLHLQILLSPNPIYISYIHMCNTFYMALCFTKSHGGITRSWKTYYMLNGRKWPRQLIIKCCQRASHRPSHTPCSVQRLTFSKPRRTRSGMVVIPPWIHSSSDTVPSRS